MAKKLFGLTKYLSARDYWMVWAAWIAIVIVSSVVILNSIRIGPGARTTLEVVLLTAWALILLAAYISLVLAGVRRLHDSGRPGGWMFIGLFVHIWPIVAPFFIGWAKTKRS
jgi:uncharacterized membrane protein YhaH (DUF805 family)